MLNHNTNALLAFYPPPIVDNTNGHYRPISHKSNRYIDMCAYIDIKNENGDIYRMRWEGGEII